REALSAPRRAEPKRRSHSPRSIPGRSRAQRPLAVRLARTVPTEPSSPTRKDHMRFTALKFWERFLRRSPRRSAPPSRRPRRRLLLEMLEDRCVPAANATASVSGFVYIDANADGIRQAQETVLPGVPVNLSGTTNQGAPVNVTAGTDASGAYSFINVIPGTYRLEVNAQSNVAGGDQSVSNIHLVGGQTFTHDFGYQGLSPEVLSLRLFLTNTTSADMPFAPAGDGQVSVGPRADNAPFVKNALQDVSVAKSSADTV